MTRPDYEFFGEIDVEIRPLLDVLNESGFIVTSGSCAGHGKSPAYVAFSLNLDKLATLNEWLNGVRKAMMPTFADDAFRLELTVVWDYEVCGSTDALDWPGWAGFDLQLGRMMIDDDKSEDACGSWYISPLKSGDLDALTNAFRVAYANLGHAPIAE